VGFLGPAITLLRARLAVQVGLSSPADRLAVQVGLLSPEHRTEFQIYIRMSEFKSNGLNYEHERLSPAHFTNVNQPLEPGAVGHYNRRVRGIRRASESGPR